MSERFLIHVVNGNGLGHVVRTMAVAIRLRERMPDARFFFLTSCEDPSPLWREGFASLKVPSLHAVEFKALPSKGLMRVGRELTDLAFATFRPTVLISDTFSRGSFGELEPYVDSDIRKVILLRPCPMLLQWRAYRRYLRLFERIIVPFEPGADVQFPGDLGSRASWVGPILLRSADALLARETARRTLGLPAQGRILLVAFGGGGNRQVRDQIEMVLQAAAAFPDVVFAVLKPPLGRYPMPAAPSGNARVISYFPILECLKAFDGAISSSGMNGSAELVYAGLPMVWVPISRASQDQVPNAQRYVDRKIGLLPEGDGVKPIRAAIARILDPVIAASMREVMEAARRPNGADLAADLIVDWCKSGFGRIALDPGAGPGAGDAAPAADVPGAAAR